MIKHYLKIAIRNILKFKIQNIISIVGLAIGFTCFALSSLWLRYELTYDSFHKDADRIYVVSKEDNDIVFGRTFYTTPTMLGQYLKENFPEVEDACYAYGYAMDYKFDNDIIELYHLTANPGFLNMFNIPVLQESGDFRNRNKKEVAITSEAASRLFHTEMAIGKELDRYGNKTTIGAVVKGWSKHSVMPFDLITIEDSLSWSENNVIYIKLRKGTNRDLFEEKLSSLNIEKENIVTNELQIIPLSAYRYSKYYQYSLEDVKFTHIISFVILGVLVIFCALFNYLTLFISNLKTRGKEMALRKINGSTNRSLFMLFSVEFGMILIFALLFGLAIIEIVMPYFKDITAIALSRPVFYTEALAYILIVAILSILASLIPIHYFRKRTLYNSMSNPITTSNRNLFRKVSIVFQLIISVGLIFCTTVMIKQLYYLNETDAINRKNKASISVWSNFDREGLYRFIDNLPMVTEVLPMHYFAVMPNVIRILAEVEEWEQIKPGDGKITVNYILADNQYAKFYNMQLVSGQMIDDNSITGQVVINETAVKEFGWDEPLGKKFKVGDTYNEVIGVVKDFQINSPTKEMPSIALVHPRDEEHIWFRADIIFSYQEGTWDTCKKEIYQFIRGNYPNARLFIYNTQEQYDRLMKSETTLLRILLFVSVICVLISLFGIYSSVTLNCLQRRKEIAIRKINGATIPDIIKSFFTQYFLLLFIAALIAFSIGYSIMKVWVQSYVRQTSIGIWLYIAIIAGVSLVMVLSILQPVLKAVKQNPAETIKTE